MTRFGRRTLLKSGAAAALLAALPARVLAQDGDILEDVDRKLKSDQLHRYISQSLDPREQKVIRLRYGLDGRAPMAQREVAALLGISRSYVSRIEKNALLKLRDLFPENV